MRIVKRLTHVLVLVLTLVIGATAAAIIVSQTAWFKNWLRGYIVRQANLYLNGTLSIERLGGNLFFGIEMENIGVSMDGSQVVAVKDLGLDYSVFQLLTKGLSVDSIRLDQPHERLLRQLECVDRRLQLAQHRPRRRSGVTRVDFARELVPCREAIAVELVAEGVDEPRVAGEDPPVRAPSARKEQRGDENVLALRLPSDFGHVHVRIKPPHGGRLRGRPSGWLNRSGESRPDLGARTRATKEGGHDARREAEERTDGRRPPWWIRMG